VEEVDPGAREGVASHVEHVARVREREGAPRVLLDDDDSDPDGIDLAELREDLLGGLRRQPR